MHGIEADHILSNRCMLLAPQIFCIIFYIKPTLCLLANQVRGLLSSGVNKLVFYAQVISRRSVMWRKTSLKWSFSIKNRYNQFLFYFLNSITTTKITEGTLFYFKKNKDKCNVDYLIDKITRRFLVACKQITSKQPTTYTICVLHVKSMHFSFYLQIK